MKVVFDSETELQIVGTDPFMIDYYLPSLRVAKRNA
jgi:hypothetical protein